MKLLWVSIAILLLAGCAAPLKPPSHPSLVQGCPAYEAYVDENTLATQAKSLDELISWGQDVQRQARVASCEWDAVTPKFQQLSAETKQLTSEQQQLVQAVSDYQQAGNSIQSRVTEYNSRCHGTGLTLDQLHTCQADQASLNRDVQVENAGFTPLQARETALNAKVADSNQRVNAFLPTFKSAESDYATARRREIRWFDQAEARLNTPPFSTSGQDFGCPAPGPVDGDAAKVMALDDAMLACLTKGAAAKP